MKKIIFLTMIACCMVACSSSSNESEYTEDKAQQVYKQMKGNYQGQIIIDNEPQTIRFILDKDFCAKQIPLKPLLGRIFTDKAQLSKALESTSTQSIDFVAPTDVLNINTSQVLLTMKPADLIFTATVDNSDYKVIATINSSAYKSMAFNGLTINMSVTELNCNGKDYDVTKEPIFYFIDSATKQ